MNLFDEYYKNQYKADQNPTLPAPSFEPIAGAEAQQALQKPEQNHRGAEAQPEGYFNQAYSSVKDIFTGDSRASQEVASLPEVAEMGTFLDPTGHDEALKSKKGFFGDLKTAAALMFVSNDQAKVDIIKENFPGVQIHKDKNGVTILEFEDGRKAVLNKPGLSFQDVQGFLGELAAFYGPTKLAGLGKSLAWKLGIAGGASAAAEAGLEKAAQALGSKQEVDPVNVGVAGVLGTGGEALGSGVKALRAIKKAKKIGVNRQEFEEASAAIKEADQITQKTGIPLFQAQKTLSPSSLERQSFIATLSSGSKKAATELKAQNKAAYNAVVKIFDFIAPEGTLETAPRQLQNAAIKAIDIKKELRQAASSPLYEKARELPDVIKFKDTGHKIKELIADLPPRDKFRPYLNGIKQDISKGLTTSRAHRLKLSLDDKITKFGEGSLSRTEKRELVEVQKTLVSELESANPLYKEARLTYEQHSPAIEELKSSILGKIANLDEINLKQISGIIYDPSQTNPAVLEKTKKIIQEVDPQAWNGITRTELERRIGTVRADLSHLEGTIENIPGQLKRAIFGNTKQRKILYRGLDKEAAKNMRWLEEGLKRASLGRIGGSQTATREEIKKEIRGGVFNSIRKLFRAPVDTTASIGEDVLFNRRVKALAEVMYDPKYKAQLKELRKLDPSKPLAEQKLTFLLELAEKSLPEISKPALQTLNQKRE